MPHMEGPNLLLDLEPDARAELLELLTSPRVVRADVIREIWTDPERRAFADVLIELEVDDDARTEVLANLREGAPEDHAGESASARR